MSFSASAMEASSTGPVRLLHGLDTVQCAYHLDIVNATGFDYQGLLNDREAIRYSADREAKSVQLGDLEFFLQPYGTRSGYSVVLTNRHLKIECSVNMTPSFFVTYTSEGLWSIGLRELHSRFMNWSRSLGLVCIQVEKLSRVDFAFDYHLPIVDFDEDAFVSRSHKDSQHRKNGSIQTLMFGKGDVVLRVYDKVAEIKEQSGKIWFYALWGRETDVWRIEWQIRKSILRRFEIRNIEDLTERCGDLLRYLVDDHDTLRAPKQDSNRSRWPLHPLWRDLSNLVRNWPGFGVYRCEPLTAHIRDRRARIDQAIFGYLKQKAALDSFSISGRIQNLEEIIESLGRDLKCWHNPGIWNRDVESRIRKIRLGG